MVEQVDDTVEQVDDTVEEVSVTDLPEHLDNPFITCLGAPPDFAGKYGILTRTPDFDPVERTYPHHLRRYCVMRLFDFVHPRACQVELVETIGKLIRSGYRHRNPTRGEHLACILDAADRTDAKNVGLASPRGLVSRATGLAFLGQPGMGKSLTVELALNALPRIVEHDLHARVVQVPWLKIECPSTGGNKQFCIAFFRALGARVGQDYQGLYGRDGRVSNEMTLDVQQLCQVHAIGILVIDELQHAAANKEGPGPLMNFLVTLTNVVGVPIMLVGTMGATPIIGASFRSARRAAGLGQPTWTRLLPGEEWEDLVKALWAFQWTAVETPYSKALGDALYDECQGIIDILIKLFMLVQFRAISIGEHRRQPETITPGLIAAVAKDELRVIRPMMRALRSGREDDLQRYPDLEQFHTHVDSVLSRGRGMTMEEFRHKRELTLTHDAIRAANPDDPLTPIRAVLATRGMAGDVIDEVMAQAVLREPSRDGFAVLRAVMELVEGRMPAKARRAKPRAAKPPRKQAEAAEEFGAEDIRGIAARAKGRGVPVHSGLVEAGISKPLSRITAA